MSGQATEHPSSADAAPWVELRVHGVSGTPPESLLGVPHVLQVAGDDYSRFYRPVPEPADHVVEGYHWGQFTSGSWRHSLTLLLVPFGLINATQFMLPRPVSVGGRLLHTLAGACLRAVALVLTELFAFALGLILIDLVGWRWADQTRLLTKFPDDRVVQACVFLSAVGVLSLGLLGWSGRTRLPPGATAAAPGTGSDLQGSFYDVNPNAPTLRLFHIAGALGMVALLADLARTGDDLGADGGPLRVVVVLALFLVGLAVVLLGDPEGAVSIGWGMAQPVKDLWQPASRYVARLLTVVITLLLLVELALTSGVDRANVAGKPEAQRLVAFDVVANDLMYAGVFALGLLYAVVVAHLWQGESYQWSRRDATARLLEVVPVVLAAAVALLITSGVWVLVAGLVLVVVLALAVWCGYRIVHPATPGGLDVDFFRPYAAGMTPFLLAALSMFIGIGFSAAAATAISSTLKLDVERGVDAGTTPMLDRVAYAWGETTAVIVVMGLIALVGFFVTKSGYRAKVAAMYYEPPADHTVLPDGWAPRVARAMFVARLKARLPLVIIGFVAVGILISVVQAYESRGCELDRCAGVPHYLAWLDGLSEPRSDSRSIVLTNLGAWVFVVGSGLVVTLSRGALKSSGTRRGINVVWDVFSFWPHAVHPFGPRPYSRWTVIELRNRIRFHLGGVAGVPRSFDGPPGRPEVVVCAHSQGSLISLAAFMLLTDQERARVAFLSCGSQLRVIYPRAFPAYVNLPTLTWAFGALDQRWVNLYRVTDPLAGPVLSWNHTPAASRHFPLPPGVAVGPDQQPANQHRVRRSGNDWRLIDPVPYDADCETGAVTGVHGHHDYWLDPEWDVALRQLHT